MNQFFKTFIKTVLALLTSLTLVQCQTEEITVQNIQESGISSKKMNIDQVRDEIESLIINDYLKNIQSTEYLKIKSQTQYEVFFNKIIKENEYDTYILPLNKFSLQEPFFKFFIIKKSKNNESACIVKYTPRKINPLLDLKNYTGDIEIFDIRNTLLGKVSFKNGELITPNNDFSARSCTTNVGIITHFCSNGGGHGPGETCNTGLLNDAYYEVVIRTICSPDNYLAAPDSFMGQGGNGGGAGSLSPEETKLYAFFDTLPEEYIAIVVANPYIVNYLLENNYSEESKEQVIRLIEQIIVNPDLNFDIEASLKSPFNIDRSAIDTTTTEGKKFNEVYDELLKSPDFKKLFTDLFQDNTRYNVKFQIANVNTGASGNTDTNLSNPTLNVITIDPRYLNSNNKMFIAKTIAHEAIHAYLNVKLCDGGQGIPIPSLNDLDFFNVVNQKYNGFNGQQDQHNFIYNFLSLTLTNILTQVKESLVTPAENANIITTVIIPNAPISNDTVPFNWSDCLHNLSLSGLQNCTFFQNEIGTIIKVNGIVTTPIIIDIVKMNNYNQYNYLCEINLR